MQSNQREVPADTAVNGFTVVDGPTGMTTHYRSDGTTQVATIRASRLMPGMSYAGEHDEVSLHHFSDFALAEIVVRLRRQVEDAERKGNPVDASQARAELRVPAALQHVRARLRWRYGARDAYGPDGDRGTDRYDHWMRHDEAPSYALAFSIDRHRYDRGKSHIVAWS